MIQVNFVSRHVDASIYAQIVSSLVGLGAGGVPVVVGNPNPYGFVLPAQQPVSHTDRAGYTLKTSAYRTFKDSLV